MQVATLSTRRPNLVLPANATSGSYMLTKIDECDIANDVTNLVNSINSVGKARKVFLKDWMDIVRRTFSGSRWTSGASGSHWWYNEWLGQLYARWVCQLGMYIIERITSKVDMIANLRITSSRQTTLLDKVLSFWGRNQECKFISGEKLGRLRGIF